MKPEGDYVAKSEDVQSFFAWTGLKVITTCSLGRWVQKRRHKKKRINKKWLKRFGMVNVSNGFFTLIDETNGVMYVHPDNWEKIVKAMQEREKRLGISPYETGGAPGGTTGGKSQCWMK